MLRLQSQARIASRVGTNVLRSHVCRAVGPAALASTILKSRVSTVSTSYSEEDKILVDQRKSRPISPDLTIYKPQFTWILSGFHRITGVFLAAGFYGITCTYAAASLFGFSFDSSMVLSAVQDLPSAVKYAAKAAIAFPFAYHFFNGLRHFVWDTGREVSIKGVYRTAYICLGLAAGFGSWLTFAS